MSSYDRRLSRRGEGEIEGAACRNRHKQSRYVEVILAFPSQSRSAFFHKKPATTQSSLENDQKTKARKLKKTKENALCFS